MEIITNCAEETEAAGAELGSRLRNHDIVALRGGLGAGKTAFTRGIANGMGIVARVTSPTYAIVNEYEGVLPLFHFDWYRITDYDDLFGIGWEEYLQRDGVVVVEWSERAPDAFPKHVITVTLETPNNDTSTGDERSIHIAYPCN